MRSTGALGDAAPPLSVAGTARRIAEVMKLTSARRARRRCGCGTRGRRGGTGLELLGFEFGLALGFLVLAVLTEKQFASLMKALDRPDALADPRFKDWPARTANEPALPTVAPAPAGASSVT